MPETFAAISAAPIDAAAVEDFVLSAENGAVVAFRGIVRNHDRDSNDRDSAVTSLDYQAHPDAERFLRDCCEAIARSTGLRVAAVHRTGSLAIGEIALIAAVAAPHRAEAFAACAELVDAIKTSVPIWKRQHFAAGSSEWVGL
jgi:molybdopterin synthase catalytic subunit